MIPILPLYIIVVFIMSTLITVGIFQYATKRGDFSSNTTKFLSVVLPFWIIFQATLAFTGFYQQTDSVPPRIFIFGIFPAFALIIGLIIFSRKFILKLPLTALTIIHIVRIPVELVLYWLYQNGQIPQLMSYEGRNFDILAGITAPLVFWLAFRGGKINKNLLIIWNFAALVLLVNIVVNSLLAFPAPFQQIAFDQPNRAVTFFPFTWLPTVIVPIILFCHLAALYKLFKKES